VQRKFDKALKALEGAIPHAQRVSKRAEAALAALRVCCHNDVITSGSPTASMQALQDALDSGIEALREDPPPVGGSADANGQMPAQQWANETKLETWVQVLPMLRALEADGLELGRAESVLVPLAEKFGLEIRDSGLSAQDFLDSMMTESDGKVGWLGKANPTTVLFVIALLLPVVLMLWLL
jgi:hypothetical protein